MLDAPHSNFTVMFAAFVRCNERNLQFNAIMKFDVSSLPGVVKSLQEACLRFTLTMRQRLSL